MATAGMADSLMPNMKVNSVAPLVAHPGKTFGRMAKSTKTMPQGSQSRENPVIAVSPVASVYRSTSMLRKYCMDMPTTDSQTSAIPTCVATCGQRISSPEPSAVAERMTLAPTYVRNLLGSGRSRYGTAGRCLLGSSVAS